MDVEFDASIAFESRTIVGTTTATIAVRATHTEELAILDGFYEYGEAIGFKLFYNKANDLNRDDNRHRRL